MKCAGYKNLGRNLNTWVKLGLVPGDGASTDCCPFNSIDIPQQHHVLLQRNPVPATKTFCIPAAPHHCEYDSLYREMYCTLSDKIQFRKLATAEYHHGTSHSNTKPTIPTANLRNALTSWPESNKNSSTDQLSQKSTDGAGDCAGLAHNGTCFEHLRKCCNGLWPWLHVILHEV